MKLAPLRRLGDTDCGAGEVGAPARAASVVVVSMHDSRLTHAASRRMAALIDELDRRGLPHCELAPSAPDSGPTMPDSIAARTRRSAPKALTRLLDNRRALPIRTIGEWAYLVWAAWTLRRLRPATVIVTIPYLPLLALPLLRRRRRCRYVLEFRDLTWDYARGASAGAVTGTIARLYERLARASLEHADVVVTTTSAQADRLQRLEPSQRPIVVRNGVTSELIDRLWPLAEQPPESDRLTVLYAGTIGYAQDVGRLLRIAELAPSAQLSIVGSGPLRDEVAEAARHLDNVTIESAVSFDELVDRYREADILVSSLRHHESFATAVPSKLYEYAATGRVVAYVGPGEAQDVCRDLGGHATLDITPQFVEELLLLAKERRAWPLEKPPAGLRRRDQAAADLVDLLCVE